MSVRRLLLTAVVMAGIGFALAAVAPAFPVATDVLSHPQQTADRQGADTVVLATAALLAWLCWGWGALGLGLTAASALPGCLGAAGRTAVRAVLPAGARRGAALLLGLGLGMTGSLSATASPSAPAAASAAAGSAESASAAVLVDERPAGPVPDWPAGPVPDWPAGPVPGTARHDVPPPVPHGAHVVVAGDCLWSIAEARLLRDHGREPSDGEVARAVQGWWAANHAVIGPDPDLLLPAQILRSPGRS
jgi:hypothetical protein